MASLFIHFHTITEETVHLGVHNPQEDQYRTLIPYLKGEKNGIALLGDLAFAVAKVQEKRLFIGIYLMIDTGPTSKKFTLVGSYIITALQGVFLSNQIKMYFKSNKENDKKVIHDHWTPESFKYELNKELSITIANLLEEFEYDPELKNELSLITEYVCEKGVNYNEC